MDDDTTIDPEKWKQVKVPYRKKLWAAVWGLSGLFAAIGLALLIVTSYCHNDWWRLLLGHLGVTGLLVGLIEMWYNFYAREEIVNQTTREIVGAIVSDENIVRKYFRDDDFEKMILALLTSSVEHQIGREQAKAIYENFIKSYVTRDFSFKESLDYRVTIADIHQDIVFSPENTPPNEKLSLRKEDCYRLTELFKFRKKFKSTEFTVGCVFDESDLIEWINRPNCLFREMLFLPEGDKEKLVNILDKMDAPDKFLLGNFKRVFYAAAKIGTVHQQPVAANIVKSQIVAGKIIGIEFHFTFDSATPESAQEFEIELTTYIQKGHHRYPVVIVERTKHPEIIFDYRDATDVKEVYFEKFFTETPAKSPVHDKERRKVIVETEENAWVFPLSGIVFFWVNSSENELKNELN